MSSSDNRIIKYAKLSSEPVIIVMRDFVALEEAHLPHVEGGDEASPDSENGGEETEESLQEAVVQPKPDEQLLEEARCAAAEMLEAARKEAADIKTRATQEAARLKEQAAAEGKSQGHETGFRQGMDEARQKMADQLAQTSASCNASLAAIEKENQRYLLEAEPKIIELVLSISRKVIADEMEERPVVVLNLVKNALEKVREQNHIIIHVSLDDYDFILQHRKDLQTMVGAEKNLSVTADPVLNKGGCMIETSFGTVEAGVDTQLEAVRRVLEELLP